MPSSPLGTTDRGATGLRVVEAAAFVAAPLAGLTLAQLGADVIRIDPIGGGLDQHRWPLAADGSSLYWAGLNRGKRSIAIDLRRPEGREIAAALITAPGRGGGLFLTNLPARDELSYDRLAIRRADLIMLVLAGHRDGGAAVDYTVNAAVGVPFVTGAGSAPVNHAVPAWDIAAGLTAAVGLLAAERHRRETGRGQKIDLALSDVALAMLSHLGFIAEAQLTGRDRPATENAVYGTFGRDFRTRDERDVMVVAFTPRQWDALVAATGLAERTRLIEQLLDVDLAKEGDRFIARDVIAAVLAPWVAQRTLDEVRAAFDSHGVLWSPFRTFTQMLAEDPRCSPSNPMFREVDHPGIGPYLVAGAPLRFGAAETLAPSASPVLGQHTDTVLADLLRLPAAEIGRLHDRRIVAGPEKA